MPRNIEKMTFNLTFFRGDEEKVQMFIINVDRDYYDEPLIAAVDHYTMKVHDKRATIGLDGFLPKFKTFRVLRSYKLDDLGWA